MCLGCAMFCKSPQNVEIYRNQRSVQYCVKPCLFKSIYTVHSWCIHNALSAGSECAHKMGNLKEKVFHHPISSLTSRRWRTRSATRWTRFTSAKPETLWMACGQQHHWRAVSSRKRWGTTWWQRCHDDHKPSETVCVFDSASPAFRHYSSSHRAVLLQPQCLCMWPACDWEQRKSNLCVEQKRERLYETEQPPGWNCHV